MKCDICQEDLSSAPDCEILCKRCFHLLRWFRGYLDVPDIEIITPDTTFQDLGVDSLDYMDWLMEADEMFNIAIPDHDAEQIDTVRAYLSFLRARGAEWPANKSIRLHKRGRWCVFYDWDVVTEP